MRKARAGNREEIHQVIIRATRRWVGLWFWLFRLGLFLRLFLFEIWQEIFRIFFRGRRFFLRDILFSLG